MQINSIQNYSPNFNGDIYWDDKCSKECKRINTEDIISLSSNSKGNTFVRLKEGADVSGLNLNQKDVQYAAVHGHAFVADVPYNDFRNAYIAASQSPNISVEV